MNTAMDWIPSSVFRDHYYNLLCLSVLKSSDCLARHIIMKKVSLASREKKCKYIIDLFGLQKEKNISHDKITSSEAEIL